MTNPKHKLITRKEAIKKTAYIAVSAVTMIVLLGNSNHVQAASPPAPLPGF